ncbi:MAG: tRNA (adenosine(37)-N6)-threonylcarbamoyltransferase complex ATPase subunit type 1 TsaE [Armatimonadetes bacterium]|nr:tRNA (adenosine(37)-N6)-threonylcarbamoyltransferase complex ATPase subunit type 1 TsaE [Armatimonadota bacterium]
MTVEASGAAVVETHAPAATEALGRRLGGRLRAGDVVALIGPLGSGKTVLARGMARGAGASGYMASPSFVVIREYPGPVRVVHVDLYRLERADEIDDLGLDELLDGAAIVIVEWADRAPWVLPPDHLRIECAMGPGSRDRVFTIVVPAALRARLAPVVEV